VQVDASFGPPISGGFYVGHVIMIRLQTGTFCDQTVNSSPRYQDLHDLTWRDC